MPYKSQKIAQKFRISRVKRVFAVLLVFILAVLNSPIAVLAAASSVIQSEFLEGDILTAEIEKLAEVKPELKKNYSEERKEKIQEAQDNSRKWTERIVLGKLERGGDVESVLGKRKDAEKVVAELKGAGAITTLVDEITGKEKEIDPTLAVSADSTIFETSATPYESKIPLDAAQSFVLAESSEAAGKVISAVKSDKQVAEDLTPEVQEEIRYFNWNTNEVTGSHEENKILYRDLWESTDLLVTADEFGMKEDIILKNSSAPTEFNYIVETIGLELQTMDDGGFVFIDSAGEEKFYTPAPNITDAEGKFVENGIRYELGWGVEELEEVDEVDEVEVDPVLAEIKFDENLGKKVYDEKSENEGKILDATWFTDEIRSSALFFDGEDDLVEIPRDFEIGKEMSLSAWVRSSEYQNSQIVGIGRHSIYQNEKKGWKAMFRVGEKNMSVAWDTPTLYLERWYFLTATFDGEKIRIFVNGEEENYQNVTGQLVSNDDLILVGGGNGNFKGAIDEVKIFSKALSKEEVRELYVGYAEGEEVEETEEVEKAEEEIEKVIVVEEVTEDSEIDEAEEAEEIEVETEEVVSVEEEDLESEELESESAEEVKDEEIVEGILETEVEEVDEESLEEVTETEGVEEGVLV